MGLYQNLCYFRIECELYFIPAILFESSWVYILYITLCYILYYILYYVLYQRSYYAKSSHRRCSVKKVLLEISKNSQENTCGRVFFLRPATLFKNRLWHRCFSVNFENFLGTPFLQNTSRRLLLLCIILSSPLFSLLFYHSTSTI